MKAIIDEFIVSIPKAHLADMEAKIGSQASELKDAWATVDILSDRLEDAHKTIDQLKKERSDMRIQKKMLMRTMKDIAQERE